MSRYWACDQQITIPRPTQDVKEALLGGNLVPFKFSLVILFTYISYATVEHS